MQRVVYRLILIIKEIEELEFEEEGIDENEEEYVLSSRAKFAPCKIIQIVKSITAREMLRGRVELKKEV